MIQDAAYWIALSQLPRWRSARVNDLIIKFYYENKLSLEEFFELSDKKLKDEYGLSEKEILDLKNAKSEIPNHSFLTESLYNQGFELIPIVSKDYSQKLKNNLKRSYSPALLYIKGDKQILTEKSIAIVGSRNANQKSLDFTDNIAKLASKEFKVVVSGFAKGVDKQALDSAIKYLGRSIIVLPQGVLTFNSGYQTYYKQIVNGDITVLSVFHPNSPWRVELAMARNTIIYGLADEIYVAQSDEKGGTWSGVQDGIRKRRTIYVRKPDEGEINANNKLIQLGAKAVDFEGKVLDGPDKAISIDEKIKEILKGKYLKADEILTKSGLDWTSKKLSLYMKKLDFIKTKTVKRATLFGLKSENEEKQTELF